MRSPAGILWFMQQGRTEKVGSSAAHFRLAPIAGRRTTRVSARTAMKSMRQNHRPWFPHSGTTDHTAGENRTGLVLVLVVIEDPVDDLIAVGTFEQLRELRVQTLALSVQLRNKIVIYHLPCRHA